MCTIPRFSSCVLILLAASFVCVASIPAFAGGSENGAKSAQPQTGPGKKVLTNEDLQALASRSGEPTVLQPTPSGVPSGTKQPVVGPIAVSLEPTINEKNPRWYAQQTDSLQAELASVDSKVRQLRQFRLNWTGTGGQVGLVLDAPSEGITTDNRINQLILRRQGVERQIDELDDTARRNGFPPGLLRETLEPVKAPESNLQMSPEEEQALLIGKLQGLEEELAQVQGVVKRMEDEAAARGMTLYPASEFGGSYTADLVQRLGARAKALQGQISAIEDDARSAGVLPGLLR